MPFFLHRILFSKLPHSSRSSPLKDTVTEERNFCILLIANNTSSTLVDHCLHSTELVRLNYRCGIALGLSVFFKKLIQLEYLATKE